MDVLAELLDGVRARGALFTQTIMNPPWSLQFASGVPLTLATMLRGQAWVIPADGDPVLIRTGDIAIIHGSEPFTVADDMTTPPQVVISSADYCARAGGIQPGASKEGSTLLLSGAYDGPGGISQRLLQALPEVLVLPDAGRHCPTLDLLVEEIANDRPGQQVVLDRLLDLMLVSTLRDWFDQAETHTPAWYRAMDDHVVSHALRLLHDDPSRPWTVADLAAESGTSRAALARRFAAQIGVPPMTYLAGWRMALAADLLLESSATVGSVARKVGYSNSFALSVAFKRLRGITPTEHRATAFQRSRAG